MRENHERRKPTGGGGNAVPFSHPPPVYNISLYSLQNRSKYVHSRTYFFSFFLYYTNCGEIVRKIVVILRDFPLKICVSFETKQKPFSASITYIHTYIHIQRHYTCGILHITWNVFCWALQSIAYFLCFREEVTSCCHSQTYQLWLPQHRTQTTIIKRMPKR